MGLDLLWLSDRKGGHQAEKDKAELPFKFDMNSGCALKEKKKRESASYIMPSSSRSRERDSRLLSDSVAAIGFDLQSK